MIKKNVHLMPPKRASAWRKISIGTWRPNGDSQVYIELRFEAGPVLRKLKALNEKGHEKITMTHIVGLIMGKVLREVPDLNALVRWGKIYPRRDVDIFFHVVYDETELSGHVVRGIDGKSLPEIARELTGNARNIRSGKDESFKKIINSWNFIPGFLARYVLDLLGFLSYEMNLNIKGLGVPQDCFGSMMITNIGSLGFNSAFVPISPYSHIPLVLALGKAELRPTCLPDGSIVALEEISLCFTFDHRVMDGARGAKMVQRLKHYFANPDDLDAAPH